MSAICAPAFVFLTRLSAWLYSQAHSKYETSVFLIERGFFLQALAVTVIDFAWTAQYLPEKFFAPLRFAPSRKGCLI